MPKKPKLYQRPDGLYEKGLTINGKRVRFRGKTEKEVYQKIAQYEEKQEKGLLLSKVAEEWYWTYETEVSYNTWYKIRGYYNKTVEYFGDVYINQITPQDISKFYNYLASQKYSKKTVSHYRTVLNNVFRYAIAQGYTKDNPLSFISLPRNLHSTKRTLPSDDEIQLVKDNVNADFGLLPYFLIYTGCRKGEALAMQFKDIDLKNKKIYINKSVYYKYNRPYIKQPKTDQGVREIPLLDKLIPFIPKGKPDDYIFSVDGSTPYPQSFFQRHWKKYQEQTGVTATPHQLRHAYATMLYEAGIDEKLAQELMGHADIQTTRNIYTHIRTSRIDDAATKLNNLDF